jgi:ligand-binding sensor domain-containing protein
VRKGTGWSFYEAKDGLPWNDFTCAAAGSGEEVWFGTRLGAIRFDGHEWQYRQGRCWLPNDEISTLVTDEQGRTWFGTASALATSIGRP